MSDLTVTLVQTALHWQNSAQNRQMLEDKIRQINRETDLVILPEMFTTGFTMEAPKFAEDMEGPTIQWMKELSGQLKIHLTGSLIIKENNHYFNRLIWATETGKIVFYDKRHLFRMAGEHKVYSAGNQIVTIELKGWQIRPFICYDLRFPVWSRNVRLAYDVAVYIANWPERRRHAWRTLLQARAAENQAYVIGVNRTGVDGLGIRYSGDSMVVDPVGNILNDLKNEEQVLTCKLARTQLEQFREKFPTWKDADEFHLHDFKEKFFSVDSKLKK